MGWSEEWLGLRQPIRVQHWSYEPMRRERVPGRIPGHDGIRTMYYLCGIA